MCLFEASLKLAAVIDSAEASPSDSSSSSVQTPLPSIPLLPAVTVEVQPITRISWSTHVEQENLWRPDPTFVIREYSDPRVVFKRLVARCDYPKGKLVFKIQTPHPSIFERLMMSEFRAKMVLAEIGILLDQLPSHDVKVKTITGEGDLDIQITLKFPENNTSQELFALIKKICSDINKLVQAKYQLAMELTAQGEHGSWLW